MLFVSSRSSRMAIFLMVIITVALWFNVQGTNAMKKKMLRKLKNMLSMSKAKKMIILPIPIPMMMDDKKSAMLNMMSGGHMLPSMKSGIDSWMMMSMMDCPDMSGGYGLAGGYGGDMSAGGYMGMPSKPISIPSNYRPRPQPSRPEYQRPEQGMDGWTPVENANMNRPYHNKGGSQQAAGGNEQISQVKY